MGQTGTVYGIVFEGSPNGTIPPVLEGAPKSESNSNIFLGLSYYQASVDDGGPKAFFTTCEVRM